MKLAGVIFLFAFIWLPLAGCRNHRAANEQAVEKLRQRLLKEEFDKVYDETSWITREQIRRDDFKEKLMIVTAKLRSIDPELRWTRNNWLYDHEVVNDDNFSALDLERDGKRMTVSLDWTANFELCGMGLIQDVNDSGERIFRNCD